MPASLCTAVEAVTIELNQEAALVLFDLLTEAKRSVEGNLAVRRPAEQKALAALKAELEKVLVAPLERDYAKQLELARERLERRSDASAQLTADS